MSDILARGIFSLKTNSKRNCVEFWEFTQKYVLQVLF